MKFVAKMVGVAEYAVVLTALLILLAVNSGTAYVAAWLVPVLALAVASLLSWLLAARSYADGRQRQEATAKGKVFLCFWAVGVALSLTIPLAELVLR